MDKKSQASQLSIYQKKALAMALFAGISEVGDNLFTLRMKYLLLRAFVIYKHRQRLSTEALYRHLFNFQERLKDCVTLNSGKTTQIPYYLLIFFAEVYPDFSSHK